MEPVAGSEPRVHDRGWLVGFLLVGAACVAALVALTGWRYFGDGRDSALWCGSSNGGLQYTCVDGAVPKDSDARGCEAYAGSYNVTEWRCAKRDP